EAVTNSIIHAYDKSGGYVKIIGQLLENAIIIQVIDDGMGIEDINAAMQPLYTSKPELERSGMGFTVMETFMDEVEVVSSLTTGTRVTMKKYIDSEKEMGNT